MHTGECVGPQPLRRPVDPGLIPGDGRGYTGPMSGSLLPWLLIAAALALVVLAVLAARWHRDSSELGAERAARQALAAEAGQLRGRLGAIESELKASQSASAEMAAALARARTEHAQAAAHAEHLAAAQEKM